MNHPDLPQNRVLIIHSLAIRLFIMRWFHFTAEEFDAMKSPKNAELIVLEYNSETHSYDLKTPLESDAANVLRSRPIRLQIRTSLDIFLKEVTQKGKAYSNNITILREVLSMRSEYGLQLNLSEYI